MLRMSMHICVSSVVRIIDEKGFEVAPFAVEKDISEVLFFEFFQIHPIKLNITFSRTEGPVKKEKRYHTGLCHLPLTLS